MCHQCLRFEAIHNGNAVQIRHFFHTLGSTRNAKIFASIDRVFNLDGGIVLQDAYGRIVLCWEFGYNGLPEAVAMLTKNMRPSLVVKATMRDSEG
jgi:hypothetical protein